MSRAPRDVPPVLATVLDAVVYGRYPLTRSVVFSRTRRRYPAWGDAAAFTLDDLDAALATLAVLGAVKQAPGGLWEPGAGASAPIDQDIERRWALERSRWHRRQARRRNAEWRDYLRAGRSEGRR